MRSVINSLLLTCVAVTGLVMAAVGPAAAQTPAGAQGKVSSLGQGKPSGKVLTREELRACLSEQATLAKRRPDVEKQQAAMKDEREELQQIAQTLNDERAAIEQASKAVAAINERTRELSAKVDDFNTRYAQFQQANRSGQAAERQRAEFEREQKELQALNEQLQAERGTVTPVSEQTLKTHNARATSHSEAASEWNARQQALAKTVESYQADRENWTLDCADRPYREDDETAIKAGK